MSLVATDNYPGDLVSDLSEAFCMFSNEAAKLSALWRGRKSLFLLKATLSYGSSALRKSRLLRNT
jgi:hypothetical protein